MSTIDRPPVSFGTLRRHLRGVPVIGPGEEGWDAARQAFNTTIDQHPALIATPLDVDDIAAVVRYAADAGLQIAPQRTGHNAAPLGDLGDSILLKTDQLQGVKIDAENRTARVRSGAKWEKVVPRASDLGLAALHGSTPDVSVAGYSLGGGLGWYGRKHGLAANSVTAIELVTADGELRRVDAQNEPELFWALRGGGGNFGVVTALEFDLYPVSEVYAGVLFFPYERSSEVLHAWREWTATVPDEVTSVGRMLQFPPIPDLPDVPARPVVRRRRGRVPRLRGRRPRADEAAARPRPGDGHVRDAPAGRPRRAAHGSAAPRPVREQQHAHRRPVREGDRRVPRRDRPRLRLAARVRRAAAHGRRARRAPLRTTAPSRRCPAASRCSRSGWR